MRFDLSGSGAIGWAQDNRTRRANASDRSRMEVLRSTPLSDKAAAKLLKKFVEAKEGEENADLVVRRRCWCGFVVWWRASG